MLNNRSFLSNFSDDCVSDPMMGACKPYKLYALRIGKGNLQKTITIKCVYVYTFMMLACKKVNVNKVFSVDFGFSKVGGHSRLLQAREEPDFYGVSGPFGAAKPYTPPELWVRLSEHRSHGIGSPFCRDVEQCLLRLYDAV
jgi:hypothetical protein